MLSQQGLWGERMDSGIYWDLVSVWGLSTQLLLSPGRVPSSRPLTFSILLRPFAETATKPSVVTVQNEACIF